MADDAQSSSPPESQAEDQEGAGIPLWVLALGAFALIAAVVVGIPIVRALVGLVFPPGPPLPPGLVEINHENLGHGYDRWSYESAQNVCEIAAFYEEAGSICFLPAGMCVDGEYIRMGYSVDDAPRCVGADTYSVFGVRWEVTMDAVWSPANLEATDGDSSVFTVEREMLWTGPAPVATSTPPPPS